MNREQQIEEMAKLIYRFLPNILSLGMCNHLAGILLQFGYRKASEVKSSVIAEEIFTEIKKFNHPPMSECKPVYVIRNDELVELEKKYLYGEVPSDE